jgi:hypothetical protein
MELDSQLVRIGKLIGTLQDDVIDVGLVVTIR